MTRVFWWIGWACLLASCASAGPVFPPGTTSPAAEASPIEIDLANVPPVDRSRHLVPLEEIIFDTFRSVNRAVPLTDIDADHILELQDAIPPIYNPGFETPGAADSWLRPDDLVLGYAGESASFAYPVRILNFHEMVLHESDGIPLLASYCPLCRSGIVYDRRLPNLDEPLVFGNTSALYESDMVMFDHATGSYWMQVSGQALVGELAGERLRPLPSQTTTWEIWRGLYPETWVLSRDTGHRRSYDRDPFQDLGDFYDDSGRFFFPVSVVGHDDRLLPGEIVLGVDIDGQVWAYPIERLGRAVVHDRIGLAEDIEVVIFSAGEGAAGAAFSPVIGGRALTFEVGDEGYVDLETGSRWSLAGMATAGELAGTQLEPLPTRSTFWFSLVSAFPTLVLHAAEDPG